MDLTPIKTRGKRRRTGESLVVAPVKRAKTNPDPKRNVKQAKASVLEKKPKASVLEKKPKASVLEKKPKASVLEKKVPLEIMEQLLWLSGNFNLPRASPRIGRLLSGQSTLEITFIRAFEPTWDDEWDIYGWGPRRGNVGDPALQSDVLDCRWANISVILKAWETYVKRRAQKYEAQKKSDDDKSNLLFFHWAEDPDNMVKTSEHINCLQNAEKVKKVFFDDFLAFRRVDRLKRNNSDLVSRQVLLKERYILSYIHVHRDTRIPDSLFASPLDEESLQKLFWLLRSGARLAEDQTWELTLEAFHHAVPGRDQVNLTAVRILALLGAFEEWPRHVISKERRRIKAFTNPSSPMLWEQQYILSKLPVRDPTNIFTHPRLGS